MTQARTIELGQNKLPIFAERDYYMKKIPVHQVKMS